MLLSASTVCSLKIYSLASAQTFLPTCPLRVLCLQEVSMGSEGHGQGANLQRGAAKHSCLPQLLRVENGCLV